MKWIVYFLVVVNLGFFAWNYRAAPWRHAATQADVEPGDDVARLRLLNEPADQATVHGSQGNDASSGAQCASLGPFDERDEAGSAAKRLRAMDIRSRVRVEHLPDKDGYWVMIPPSQSRSAARKTIAKLRANGVKDYFLVATGDTKNAISLGVYSSRAAARQRVSDMRELGFSPQMQGVALPHRRYWLDLSSQTSADDVEAALKALLADYPHLRRDHHACQSG
ncbi:MAG: SPOR domain-containing protein [Gammaproteobacteria bacterium]